MASPKAGWRDGGRQKSVSGTAQLTRRSIAGARSWLRPKERRKTIYETHHETPRSTTRLRNIAPPSMRKVRIRMGSFAKILIGRSFSSPPSLSINEEGSSGFWLNAKCWRPIIHASAPPLNRERFPLHKRIFAKPASVCVCVCISLPPLRPLDWRCHCQK